MGGDGHAGADVNQANLLHDIRLALRADAEYAMTRARKAKQARKRVAQRTPPKRQRRVPAAAIVLALAGLVGLVAAIGVLVASDDEATFSGLPAADPGPVHVHGLGVNPADGSLFIATHTGMWRVPEGARKATRVGELYQDTMGFTIAGPNYFLGSGHPDINEAREKNLPSLLGLIESRDGGKTWKPISLLGEADFHVLRFAGERVYGYDSSNDRLLASRDRGRTWDELDRPGPLVDLAANPQNADQVLASTEAGLFRSNSGGRKWTGLAARVGLVAWPEGTTLYLVEGNGDISFSGDRGDSWIRRGNIGGEPAALFGRSAQELYVALHDGTIKRSADGGRSWTVRSTP